MSDSVEMRAGGRPPAANGSWLSATVREWLTLMRMPAMPSESSSDVSRLQNQAYGQAWKFLVNLQLDEANSELDEAKQVAYDTINELIASRTPADANLNKPLHRYLAEERHQIAQDFDRKGLIQFVTSSLADGTKVRRRVQIRLARDERHSEQHPSGDAETFEEDDQRPLRKDATSNNSDDDPNDATGEEPRFAVVEALVDAIRAALELHPDAEMREPEILAAICMRLIEKRYAIAEPGDLLPSGQLPYNSAAYGHGVLTDVGREFFKDHRHTGMKIRRIIALLNEALPAVRQQFSDKNRPATEEQC